MAATLKTTLIQEPSSATVNLTLNTDGTMTTGTNMTVTGTSVMSSPYTMRNKIINGAMVIDQRNGGAAINSASNNSFGVDRFNYATNQSGKFNIQQNAGSVTPPAGFTNYLGFTSTSAFSAASGDYFWVDQRIEGYNVSDLALGMASAQPFTFSFWVRSSLTGTHSGALQNASSAESYVFTYTINAANNWEYKTVSVPARTSGTWNTTNGIGLFVSFNLGSGSNWQTSTTNAWQTAQRYAASGSQSIVGTNGATFYVTGVQLERGTIATPFEWRNYQQELAMCKRYYDKTFPINTAPVTNYGRSGAVETYAVRTVGSAVSSYFRFSVPMRATPTMTFYNPQQTNNQARNLDLPGDCTSTGVDNVSEIGGKVLFTLPGGTGSTNLISVHFSADAEL